MKQKLPIIILIAASLLLLAYITPSFLHNKQHEVSNNQLVASHIYGLIEGATQRPIGISTGLSSDEFLIRALERESETDEKDMEAMISSYLTAVKNQFGYVTAFVISEKSHKYFTSNGVAKIVNPFEDPYDNWYPMFINSGLDLEVETDKDQLFDYRWSIFINVRMKDSEGKTIGVCGIGIFMEQFQAMLAEVEKQYKVKINLIDRQGLVQVDTDFNNIKNAYLSEALSDNATPNGFTHTKTKRNSFRMTRYMPNLNWYLVVQGKNVIEAQNTGRLAIILINLFLVAAVILILFSKKMVIHHEFIKSTASEDELTGLPNRNYLKESYGELGVFNTTRYKTLAVFDIDHFKIANDEKDGDKIIIQIVELAKEAMNERGIMFRWAGDEFVLFLEMESLEAEIRLQDFCDKVAEKLKVTISVGLVNIDLSVSIKTNYHRAVQACYAIKEHGGNGVGKR